jgi:outer membrane protein assembly factor BamD
MSLFSLSSFRPSEQREREPESRFLFSKKTNGIPARIRRLTAFHLAGMTILLLLLGGLTACAGDKEKDALPPDEPVETLYNRAADQMDKGEYKEAAKQFAEVERQHPYSQWATKAQIMEGYAQYQALDYDDAVATLNQFIELHPGNAEVGYAYYLRALCSYERIVDVRRDQGFATDALKGMQEVVTRFPDTVYAKDAVLKIALIYDHLAGAEMEIGRWYMTQKLYIAAIGRFRTVVDKYQTTSHTPEALERLVECYIALGITDEAKTTAAVLGYNFPGSDWYADAYRLLVKNNLTPEDESGSWIGSVWHKVF